MATAYPLPDLAKVKQMLGLLFDGLDVKAGKKFDIVPPSGSWIGLYVCDDGSPVAACAVDALLAANAGAALSMLPPAVAKDAAKAKELTDVMVANLQEIMNICSRLVMTDSSRHLKLDKVYPAKAMPPQLMQLLGAVQGRVDFELNVPKYGVGTLAVLSS
ncbi:MAG: hypothetical protein JSR54_10590 [Proteobacteria bacterium]|nr:hypothetical protein [Pseudomonadota bacterium]